MKYQTGFEETTGECLASCGGDSIEGHASDCPLAEMVDDLATLRAQNAELIAALANLTRCAWRLAGREYVGDTKREREEKKTLEACRHAINLIARVKGADQ